MTGAAERGQPWADRRGLGEMTLPKFIIGMIFVIAVVAIWSVLDSASWGVVLLRTAICALVLQIGYFLIVLVMVARQSSKSIAIEKSKEVADPNRPANAKDLSVGRSISR
jgi:exopolysaccharide production repressor protein